MSNRGKFVHCASCINREYDPFQCQGCVKGSNYEAEVEVEEYEEMTYDEFRSALTQEDWQ